MFLNQTHLEHLLQPEHYFSVEQYQLEMKRLFQAAWFVVAATEELPRSGDFLTTELLGKPLIVRNFNGELKAFLNVCAHRHCKLTHLQQGRSEKMRCQYHGWEFKADGYTAHIPEAKIFRPIDRDQARLTEVRLETCGSLVFATLAAVGPSLAEFLGPFHEQCRTWFSDSFRFARSWITPAEANWKVLVENSVESYHVPMVHPTSFGVTPAEEICRHQLLPHGSTFESDETLAWRQWGQTLLVRSMGLPVTNVYTHHLAYPHLQFVNSDLGRVAIMILPTSPTTCEQRVWTFGPRGTRRNPWAWLVRSLMQRVVPFETRRVLGEDAAILNDVQTGLQASPHRGVIGTREERVHAFQQHVLERIGSDKNDSH